LLTGRGGAQLDDIVVDNVAAVPEASIWAMIILGFAGVGFMAYRRKTVAQLDVFRRGLILRFESRRLSEAAFV
jgi:hypothetical protein